MKKVITVFFNVKYCYSIIITANKNNYKRIILTIPICRYYLISIWKMVYIRSQTNIILPTLPSPSSLIPHTSSLILHPSSFILHPSSFIIHPSYLIPHTSYLIIHNSQLTTSQLHNFTTLPRTSHPAPRTSHPSSFTTPLQSEWISPT